MRWFWPAVVALEAATVAGFVYVAANSNFITRMPPTVRHGASNVSLVMPGAMFLVLALLLADASIWCWIAGVRARGQGSTAGFAVLLAGSLVLFAAAGVALLGVLFVGFPQY